MTDRQAPIDRPPARAAAPVAAATPAQRRRPAVTPARAFIAIGLAVGLACIVWALVQWADSSVPLLATGMLVLGVVFVALAIGGAIETYRSAADGESGRALATALLGGLAAVVAFGCLAVATVLTLLWRTAT